MKEDEKKILEIWELRKKFIDIINPEKFEIAMSVMNGLYVELAKSDGWPKEIYLQHMEKAWDLYDKVIEIKEDE